MTATIIPFRRRDIMQIVSNLIILNPSMTGKQLLERHDQLRSACAEAYAQSELGQITIKQWERVTVYVDTFHKIAESAGVCLQAVQAFNTERADWKSWALFRQHAPSKRS